MEQDFSMIGGDHETSYAKNSWIQRSTLENVKPVLDECFTELVKDIGLELQSDVRVGDLGCSSGPNAFLTAQNIIQTFDKHYQLLMNLNQNETLKEIPIIQYFMNDLVSNDFNLVFKGLSEFNEKMIGNNTGGYIIADVPGTFYGKLFLHSSMHFLHSSYCLHCLSQAPKGLVTQRGTAMNKLNIYCARTSSPGVKSAYKNQFKLDFDMFLRMRSPELVEHGQLLVTFLCENKEEEDIHNFLHLMGSALSMVKEGCLEKEKLENSNLTIYIAAVCEIRKIIEDEGSFEILKFKDFKTPLDFGYEFSSKLGEDDDLVPGKAKVHSHVPQSSL